MGKRHLLHVRSSAKENNLPKLPSPNDLSYGEIAINYVKGDETISLKNSDNQIVAFNIGKSIKGVNVNGVNATINNNIASVTISGSNENVGTYTTVTYPSDLSGAVNVSGSQTIAQAFNAVETTISALTEQTFDNQDLLAEHLETLSGAVANDISGVSVNGVTGTVSNKIASVVISGSDANVGNYTTVTYPSDLSGAVNVSGSQTVAQAFNAVETTISALTQEVIKDEKTISNSIEALATAAGTINEDNDITYEPNENANYISAATSLYDADIILDSKIKDIDTDISGKADINHTHLGSAVTIGDYTTVVYPTEFSGAVNVTSAQTVPQSFNAVETTISALTQEVIDNEQVVSLAITDLATAAGTINSENDIVYEPNENANYISAATSLYNADTILDSKIKDITTSITTINYAESQTNPGGPAKMAVSIPRGKLDASSTAAAMTATVSGITELRDGVCCLLTNGVVAATTASTLNINGLGAKPLYATNAAASKSNVFGTAYTMLFIYNETRVASGCWDVYYGYYTYSNTLGYNLSPYYSRKTKNILYRYKIVFTYDETYFLPVCTTDSTGATKALTTESFDPFGEVYYYSATATTNASGTPGAQTMWTQRYDSPIDLKYSFNEASGLTARKDVYVICVPQEGGKVKLLEGLHPITQTLPTTADGHIYKKIGFAYDTYRLILTQDKPCYYFKDNEIRLWTNQTETDISGKADIDHTHVSSAVTIESGYQPTSYPQGFTGATNVESGQTVTQALQNVESTISELADELIRDEKTTDKALIALATAAGTIDSGDSIEYIADTQANYISAATSLAEADSLLDAAIGNKADANHTHLENYARITYPSIFSGAVNVTSSQTVSQAFNAVETTISALTEETLANERVTLESVDKTVKAAGLFDSNNKIKYVAPQTRILSGATSLYEADELLETAISNATVAVVNHGTSDTTFALTPNTFHVWGAVTSLNLTLATPTDNTILNEYMFEFESPSTATNLVLPNTVEWITIIPIEANKTYQVSIINNLGVIGGA